MTFERFSDSEHLIPGCFCFAAPMCSVSGYEWFVSRCRPIMGFLRDPRNRVSTWISRGERIIKSVTLIADKISRRSPGKKVIRSIVSLASLADRSAMLDARDAWILIGARDERKLRLLVRSLLANRVVYSTEIMVLLIEFE